MADNDDRATLDDDDGLILLEDLRPYIPLHPQQIRKLIKRQEFPQPVKLGRRTAFVRREILAFCRDQAGRRA
jgi:predicted DNA-binding transcriptional regulator AlpA